MFNRLWQKHSQARVHAVRLPVKARHVVIGAGYAGLSTALELSAGSNVGSEVVVIDAIRLGYGASGRNGGQAVPGFILNPHQLVQHFSSPRSESLAALVGGAHSYVFRLIKRSSIECGTRKDGWIQAAHNENALRSVQAIARQWQTRGGYMQMLNNSQGAKLLGTSIYQGGLLDKRLGQLQSYDYVHSMASIARLREVKIFEQYAALQFCQPTPGLTAALGYYGRGVAMGTRTGALVADMVQGLAANESVYPETPFKALPATSLHRNLAWVAANVMCVQDLIKRRARGTK